MIPRNLFFIFFNIMALIIFYTPVKELITLSFHEETYSHIVLIPLISGYFIYSKRKTIFAKTGYSFTAGSILIIIGIILYLLGRTQGGKFNQNDYLSLMTFAALVFWLGGFTFFYGTQSFRSARFPFLFLIFMIPIPTLVLDKIIFILQNASAEAVHGLFTISGIPFFREGVTFQLTELSVEVAEQCSGIRSSIALFITSILAGHLFLNSTSRKIILILFVFPITIVKNSLRIVTLTLLGNYVDVRILSGALHKQGGIPFFILAFTVLGTILWFLRKSEVRKSV